MKFELAWKEWLNFDWVILEGFSNEVSWESGSQLGVILPPRGHLALAGDIFVVTGEGQGDISI